MKFSLLWIESSAINHFGRMYSICYPWPSAQFKILDMSFHPRHHILNSTTLMTELSTINARCPPTWRSGWGCHVLHNCQWVQFHGLWFQAQHIFFYHFWLSSHTMDLQNLLKHCIKLVFKCKICLFDCWH